jgi:CubicO group peptidase (beta-lactamase class C family)
VVERICAPLGMMDTRVTLTDDMRARLAPPYNEARLKTYNWDFDSLAGCGAIRSTADDLLRFGKAYLHPESLT